MPGTQESKATGLKGFVVNHKVWAGIIALFVVGVIAAAASPSPEPEAAAPSSAPTTEAPTTEAPVEVEEHPMPEVIGLSLEEATQKLEKSFPPEWEITLDAQVSSAKGADGGVLTSDPSEGESVQDGDTITIEAAYPLMPNLIGKQANSANQLKSLGLDVVIKKKVGTPAGTIIAQEPKVGQRILPGQGAIVITVAKKPPLTVSQENAIATAEDYLDYTAFSKTGLAEQLEFEGFSAADAQFAVDHIRVNWNEQAAKSAKDYLDYSSFSRQGLIDQLVYEGFTYAQATYGVNQTGL